MSGEYVAYIEYIPCLCVYGTRQHCRVSEALPWHIRSFPTNEYTLEGVDITQLNHPLRRGCEGMFLYGSFSTQGTQLPKLLAQLQLNALSRPNLQTLSSLLPYQPYELHEPM